MKTISHASLTTPPKRLLYKGFTYILATQSHEGADWAKTVPKVEALLELIKEIAEDERKLTSNKQDVDTLWKELNTYFKLLIPR